MYEKGREENEKKSIRAGVREISFQGKSIDVVGTVSHLK